MRLYTYLPKENTADTDGLLSTALTPDGWKKYQGRTGKTTREAVLAALDKLNPDLVRSRTLSALSEPIPDTANQAFRDFTKAKHLYSFDTKDLIRAAILERIHGINVDRRGTHRVSRPSGKKIDWSKKEPRKFLFSAVPHYLVQLKGGKVPPEFVRDEEKKAEHTRFTEKVAAVLRKAATNGSNGIQEVKVTPAQYGGGTGIYKGYAYGKASPGGPGIRGAAAGAADAASFVQGWVNRLMRNPVWHRNIGGGSVTEGRRRAAIASKALSTIPVINESAGSQVNGRPASGVAHTNVNGKSYVAVPAAQMVKEDPFYGKYYWQRMNTGHEVFHRVARETPGYLAHISSLQRQEGVQNTGDYLHSPEEHAAQFNALRMMHGAMPGKGSGIGGKYTPEEARRIFRGDRYFKDTPISYQLRLLNEAKNVRRVPHIRPDTTGIA